MKIAIITLTENAEKLGRKVQARLLQQDEVVDHLSKAQGSKLTKKMDGKFKDNVKKIFNDYDAHIFIMATGIVVRTIAPLLKSKQSDPAVVVMDEMGAHAISLTSGHIGGANRLVKRLEELIGSDPVITTASDIQRRTAVDIVAEKLDAVITDFTKAKEITAQIVSGKEVTLTAAQDIGILPGLTLDETPGGYSIVVSPFNQKKSKTSVHLVPQTIIAGIGFRIETSPGDIEKLVRKTLKDMDLHRDSLTALATIDIKEKEGALQQAAAKLGVTAEFHSVDAILKIEKNFKGSDFVKKSVGVSAVAEPAASLSGKSTGSLLMERKEHKGMTIALWECALPMLSQKTAPHQERGSITVVGMGPGKKECITPEAMRAIRDADTVIAYKSYINLLGDITIDKEVIPSPMRGENERCIKALKLASSGKRVALVSSGDAGIYGMAGLMLEIAEKEKSTIDISVIAGITAVSSAAAVLGAPLMHDFAVISLSDHLTEWELIQKRIEQAAEADFVIALYNPKSSERTTQIERACKLMLKHKDGTTPVGIVRNAGRHNQKKYFTTLDKMCDAAIDMRSLVIIGNSCTRISGEKMITPRGYDL